MGNAGADGRHHLLAHGGQTDHDADAAERQDPPGDGSLTGNLAAGRHDGGDRGERTDGVGHVVGAVGKGHGTGGDDHQDAEHLLHVGEVHLAVILRVVLLAANVDPAGKGHRDGDGDGEQDTLAIAQVQTDVGQPLLDGDQADHQRGQEHVEGDVALGVVEGIIGVEDELLHADEHEVGDDAGDGRSDHPGADDAAELAPLHRFRAHAHHGEADDGADDGVGGGDGPAEVGGQDQPGAGGQQGGDHAEHQQIRSGGKGVAVDDAVADGGGDFTTGQIGTGKFKDHGDDDRLTDGQGFGADRRAHGVGHVIRTNAPGHQKAEQGRHEHQSGAVIRDNVH